MEKRILLVDPVYTRLLLEKTCLSRKEYQIFTSQKGSEGLKKAREIKPHLILFSSSLGDIDGAIFCKKIREDEETRKTSLLLVVAKEEDHKVSEIMASGCNDFITFPLNKLILDQKLGIYLNIATRKAARIMVQIKIEAKSYQGFHLGTSVNLSKSGMLLETPINLNREEEIFLKFFLPKSLKQIETKAMVVREENLKNLKRYGLKFVEMDPDFEKMVEEFTEKE
ncbi:MAG: PilZ domain-containing protein [Thermoanaerobaculia bacterium]